MWPAASPILEEPPLPAHQSPPRGWSQKLTAFKAFTAQAWALTKPYFQSEEKWKARGLLVAIVALNLALVYMAVLFNDWNRLFYDALQDKNAAVFWTQLGRFTYLAFAFIVMAVYKFYLTQLLEMRWRAWMTGHYLQRWLANHAFYQLELTRFTAAGQRRCPQPRQPGPADSGRHQPVHQLHHLPDHGAAQCGGDAGQFCRHFVGTVGRLCVFTSTAASTTFPASWSGWRCCTALAGSVLTHYIGRPQIKLNFQQQRVEADFRHHMVRVREYSESIALDRGEAVERVQLDARFSRVLGNYLALIKAQKNLIWFTSFFGQAALVFPFMVAAPRFFSGAIQLGELMQISSAFGQVQGSLSWFVDSYSSLASWRATTDRLTSFEASFRALAPVDTALSATDSVALDAHDLTVALPDGAVLLAGAALHAKPGDSVLLQGPSGSGKSTLFRTLAGIWPFASGSVSRPAQAMFIPQRPYFPNGSAARCAGLSRNRRPATAMPKLRQALHDALLPATGGPTGPGRRLEPKTLRRRAATAGHCPRAAEKTEMGVCRRGHQRARRSG